MFVWSLLLFLYLKTAVYILDLRAVISFYCPTEVVKFIYVRTSWNLPTERALSCGDLLIWQPWLLPFYVLNVFDSSHSVDNASWRGIGSGFSKEAKEFKRDHLMSYLDCLEDWKQFISESNLLCRCPLSLTKSSAGSKVILGWEELSWYVTLSLRLHLSVCCFSESSPLAGIHLWFVLVNEWIFLLDTCTSLLQFMQSQTGAETL